ncbi:MAG: DUF1801 domain-containing protein [Rhizobiaceae bacterium]|nr:DUF1801 domain-containing protein [Rhizobiaceae bacterium]
MESSVAAVFESWDDATRRGAMTIRQLIFSTGEELKSVGPIDETLKWNQPAYLTLQTRSGSTIRMGAIPKVKKLGLYFHCQTTLVETFRSHYTGRLDFEKNRAIILNPLNELPLEALKHCIGLALTYHLNK